MRVKKKTDADECIIKSTRGMIPRSILDRPKKGFDFVCPHSLSRDFLFLLES
jgi:hypothetical protein